MQLGSHHRVTTNEAADDFVQRIKTSQDDARAAMAKAQEMMARAYDQSKRAPIEYHPGDQVYLKGTNIHSDRPVKKLDDRQYGPFKVDKLVGLASYRLHLPKTWKTIHPVFHESLLSPYTPPSFHSQRPPPPPPPEVTDGTTKYEIDYIVDSRIYRGKLQYLVHWTGYRKTDRTWQPAAELLQDAPLAVTEFHDNHPSAPRGIPARALQFQPMPASMVPVPSADTLRFHWELGVHDRSGSHPVGRA